MRATLIFILALGVVACGDDASGRIGGAGAGGASTGGAQAGNGSVGGASGVGSTGGTGVGGAGGAPSTSPSAVCLALIEKAGQCGLPAPEPSRCKAENECEDGCTLPASCQELKDLGNGDVPPAIQTCFDGCP